MQADKLTLYIDQTAHSIVSFRCTTIQFGYDADYHRTTKTITSGAVSHSVNDVYVLGHLAYQTDQTGTTLATFTYDSMGTPVSVQVGSDPNTAPRYYYVYNGHGDVVALVDASGNSVASYSYDAFGQLTAASENFGGATTWTNPYRYDGRDGVRYDGETGLYWMSVWVNSMPPVSSWSRCPDASLTPRNRGKIITHFR